MSKQKTPSNYQFITYVVILLFAFGLRINAFNYGLPFVENTDAPNFYLVVNDNRGLLDAQWRNNLLAGYPPAYIWLYARVSDIVDLTGDYNVHIDQQYYTANMRIISVFASLITLATVITLAKYLGGDTAGLIAGVVFAVSSEVIKLSVLSLPDPLTTMFMCLTALVTVVSLRKHSVQLALIGTVLALISIAFKYPVAPILLLPASFFLLDLWKRRLRALPGALLALLVVLATAYYLLYINGGANFDIAETRNFRGNLFANLFEFEQWQATLTLFFDALGIPFLLLSILSISYPFILKKQERPSFAFWILLLTAIPMLVLVPLYLVRLTSVRYVYPAMALFTIVLAVPQRYLAGWVKWVAVALIIISGLFETGELLSRINSPYTYAEAQFWAEENMPDESVVWMETHFPYRSLTRYEAGYSGYNDYGLMYAPTISWMEAEPYLDYVYLADTDLLLWNSDETRPPLADLLLIKEIAPPGYSGPAISIYDPHPPENLSNIELRDSANILSLRAYELEQDNQTMTLVSYWQAPESRPTVDYSYVIYLTSLDEPETIIFQQDARLGHRPTSTWVDPNELLRGNIAAFTISDDVPAGTYRLSLGVYYWETGERMLSEDSNRIHIADIELP